MMFQEKPQTLPTKIAVEVEYRQISHSGEVLRAADRMANETGRVVHVIYRSWKSTMVSESWHLPDPPNPLKFRIGTCCIVCVGCAPKAQKAGLVKTGKTMTRYSLKPCAICRRSVGEVAGEFVRKARHRR